jgi:ABC-type sugar transport system substrate-binding protein
MKAARRATLVATVVAVALVVAACGGSSKKSSSTQSGSSSQSSKQVTIGVALPDLTAFQGVYGLMYNGMKAAAAQQNVKIELSTVTGEFSPQKYLNAIDDVVARGVKVVGFQAFDPKIFKSFIARLNGNGVKVVNIGDVPVGNETSDVNTDTKGAVRAGMEDLAKQLGGSGKIALLLKPTVGVVRQRIQYAQADAKDLGLTVVGVTPVADCTAVDGANAAQDVMQAHPDLNAIFAGCGQPGVGAANAVKQSGKHVLVYSYDGSPDELKLVKAGTIAGAIRQRFEAIGAASIKAMAAIARGEAVQKLYAVPGFDVVDKGNVDQFLK